PRTIASSGNAYSRTTGVPSPPGLVIGPPTPPRPPARPPPHAAAQPHPRRPPRGTPGPTHRPTPPPRLRCRGRRGWPCPHSLSNTCSTTRGESTMWKSNDGLDRNKAGVHDLGIHPEHRLAGTVGRPLLRQGLQQPGVLDAGL